MNVHKVIADLARSMHADVDARNGNVENLLETITQGALANVPGTQYAGVLLVDAKKNFETLGATDPVMHTLDQLQRQTNEGPCLEAAWKSPVVRSDVIATDPRWPRLSERTIAETPARSALSFQLFTHDGTMGALNMFSDLENAFDQESEEIGLVYATHAALALYAGRRQGDFRSALASRDLIGQAKGMIMERYKIDSVQAFALISKLSQDSNTPVRQLAAEIVETGPDL